MVTLTSETPSINIILQEMYYISDEISNKNYQILIELEGLNQLI